jgi:hypothetical protein
MFSQRLHQILAIRQPQLPRQHFLCHIQRDGNVPGFFAYKPVIGVAQILLDNLPPKNVEPGHQPRRPFRLLPHRTESPLSPGENREGRRFVLGGSGVPWGRANGFPRSRSRVPTEQIPNPEWRCSGTQTITVLCISGIYIPFGFTSPPTRCGNSASRALTSLAWRHQTHPPGAGIGKQGDSSTFSGNCQI